MVNNQKEVTDHLYRQIHKVAEKVGKHDDLLHQYDKSIDKLIDNQSRFSKSLDEISKVLDRLQAESLKREGAFELIRHVISMKTFWLIMVISIVLGFITQDATIHNLINGLNHLKALI